MKQQHGTRGFQLRASRHNPRTQVLVSSLALAKLPTKSHSKEGYRPQLILAARNGGSCEYRSGEELLAVPLSLSISIGLSLILAAKAFSYSIICLFPVLPVAALFPAESRLASC